MIKPALDIRPGQRQRLTPYLQRSVQVLQASSQALQKEIASALASNPFLEEDDPVAKPGGTAKSSSIEAFRDRAHSHTDRSYPSSGSPSVSNPSPESPQTPANRNGHNDSPHLDRVENMPGTPSLQHKVAHELSLHRFSSREQMIVEGVIGCLNSRGYLDASFDELRLILPAECPFDDSEIEHVLGRIQEVEPAGIGARNLRECLLLQLQHLNPDTPGLTTAIQVVKSYLFYLAERRTKQLLETLQISRDTLA